MWARLFRSLRRVRPDATPTRRGTRRGRFLPVLGAWVSAWLWATPTSACVLVFGQGRNVDAQWTARNQHWDEINRRFNLAVREPLVAAGLPVINLVLPVDATDVPANLRGLVTAVQRHGCTRVLETTMFADPAAGLLIARLRLYPVLGLVGPQAAGVLPRIGPVSYTEQREFALDARVMDRAEPGRLGRWMGEAAVTGALLVAASGPASAASASASAPAPAPAPAPSAGTDADSSAP